MWPVVAGICTIVEVTVAGPSSAGSVELAGGASVVFVDPGASLLFEDFRDDAILSVYPPDPPI